MSDPVVAAAARFALYREVVWERFNAPRLPPPPARIGGESMGLFTSKPADDHGDMARGKKGDETPRQKVMRRAGKQAADHNARVTDPDKWPNHDKRGRGSR